MTIKVINPTMRLVDLHAGEVAVLSEFGNGRGFLSRLTALGFSPGGEVTMVQNLGHGPLLVVVRGTKVALGRREAADIRVLRRDA